jgi:hypothetical protein
MICQRHLSEVEETGRNVMMILESHGRESGDLAKRHVRRI